MFCALTTLVIFLFASTSALGQENRLPQAAEHVRPCTLHPVNGRVCLSEGVLRGFLMRYVPPKLPQGANETGDVALHVIVPRTGGRPTTISAISGDPALTRSAVRAVRDWVFMGYVYKGEPIEMEGDLHIHFKAAE